MQRKVYTIEELMLNDSFFNYCLDNQSPDKEFWEKEMAMHNDQQAIFAEARYTINLLYGKLDDLEVNRQVEKIKNQINARRQEGYKPLEKWEEPTKQFPGQKPAKHFRRTYILSGIAASVLVLLGIGLFTHTSSKVILPLPERIGISYASGIGERKTIQLPDGSVVILNSSSRITLAGDYNRKERTILLTGEAFFQVAKDPAKPFTVHSGALFVTAVGTSFYVHARDREKHYKVELLEGKVRLASKENKLTSPGVLQTTLLPGEEGAWQSAQKSFTKTSGDSTILKKWISGKLSFKNMPVDKVLNLLQQWYGVSITVNHLPWGKLKLTGDYDNKPLDHVLKIICFSLSAGYSYSDNQVIIE